MRCEESLTASPKDAGHTLARREFMDEGSLADAGLAAHQHDGTARAADDARQRGIEYIQIQLAFEQFHVGKAPGKRAASRPR